MAERVRQQEHLKKQLEAELLQSNKRMKGKTERSVPHTPPPSVETEHSEKVTKQLMEREVQTPDWSQLNGSIKKNGNMCSN